MKKTKSSVYYSDPINDDFAKNITKSYKIGDDFKYIHKNIIFRFLSWILYHVIAIPIFYCYLKIKYHVKVYNKKVLKELKGTGYFVYMNHTQNIIDAYINQAMICRTRKGHIIASNDVYSLKAIKPIIDMLGCIPTPNNMVQSKNFFDAVKYYMDKKDVIVVLPEAHIWPYYNDIRPFLDQGFFFPAMLNKPVVTTTVVYRERKNGKRPYISLYISSPVYPKENTPVKENQKYLRDESYNNMKRMVKEHNSYEYIHYEQKTL